MASNSANTEKTEIDQMFFVPEGVIDLVVTDNNVDDIEDVDTINDFNDTYVEAVDDNTVTPTTPDILALIEQRMQVGPAGDASVDVDFEVDDLFEGEYEYRITVL